MPIRNAYFITAGLACTVLTMLTGPAMATLVEGREGFVGLPVILGSDSWPAARTVMMLPGSAYVIEACLLEKRLNGANELGQILRRYGMTQMVILMQKVACARLHGIGERLACWLLMIGDRVGGQFKMTHENMAELLGNRRATVSLEAEKFQRAGMIKYVHGRMHILSRERLRKTGV